MLNDFFSNPLTLGAAQAAVVSIAALLVAGLAHRFRIRMGRELAVALARGLVQVVAVGFVLVLMLRGPQWTSVLALAAMILSAAGISARRTREIPQAFAVSLWSIGLGSGLTILLMTWTGVIGLALTSLVPVGSMIIANAMNSNTLALDRFRSEIEAHTGQIEAGLALGAGPARVTLPYVQAAVQASLIPRIDSLRSLGIVWIPGIMAGMLLQGAEPVHAALYQFVIIAMIFSSSGLTTLASTLLIRSRAFSAADQLLLRG